MPFKRYGVLYGIRGTIYPLAFSYRDPKCRNTTAKECVRLVIVDGQWITRSLAVAFQPGAYLPVDKVQGSGEWIYANEKRFGAIPANICDRIFCWSGLD